ncbi:MAG: hypothetical protein JWN52_1418 [Actinomycetia bacterium]|jgi:hypothetical protein|nr:hypothetical protein [Actinomycetes bacterium]
MNRQIATGYGMPSTAALEERIAVLENRVAVLTEALRVLTKGLAAGPFDEPGGGQADQAARLAHDLLIRL